MTATTGAPKSLDDLQVLLKDDNKIKVAGVDVDGVLRGKFMSKSKFLSAASSDGFGFCSVIFGWDIHDGLYSRELLISNKANGYRDILAKIDLSTYRRIPWENNVPFFLVSFYDPDTLKPLSVCPRGTLSKALSQAGEYNWNCIAGVEYEYFQFSETAHTVAEKGFTNLTPLTPGMHGYSLLRTNLNSEYFNDLFDVSNAMGIEIEGHHTETGPGVFETALAYTYALRMADNAQLFKFVAKSVGMQNGIMPSFMAKPWGNLPGCSGHVHVSLRDRSGKNVFALPEYELKTGRANAAYQDTKFMSQEGEWFLAGILDGLTDVVPLLVPTINGYKRLVGGETFWAPNAVTYGYDSRAASIRIISPPSVPPSATRLEIRVPGADMNPYFTLSAIFKLGLRGIALKLALPSPPITQYGDGPGLKPKSEVVRLATSLEGATKQMMRPGSVAREVFGDEFVDHYGGTREHEVFLWNQAVTNWEVERYLELA
ncbi:glutamine synthetase/guanido kinase [Sistotremastrum niveocremeum HHB9708]|uniref:Glutamine synthetase n=1 Tax=Sistotremastrum niveocremeum HHB9708 TaxID=1314777 RepID=A0A164S4A4_9AGAM|nr:glutamine synthetase/guanido kinase [Sistotremastrum niveocremeum HHB9708]